MPGMIEDSAMLSKARAELEQVRTEIARLKVRETRLQQFVELFDTQRPEEKSAAPIKIIDYNIPLRRHLERQRDKVAATTKDRVSVAVSEILADGRSMQTRDILRELQMRGVSVGGAAIADRQHL